MVAVFAIFATLSFLDFKEMGVGLAAAILIDATVIRGVLLPATMKLLGERNWYLPGWLEWLPRVSHEGAALGGVVPSAAPDGAAGVEAAPETDGARGTDEDRVRPTRPAADEGVAPA
jgi:RND superfamily putative drug exporter